MQFQRVNRTDPEKVFISVYNNLGTALVAGEVVEFVASATAGTAGAEIRSATAAVNLTTGLQAQPAGVCVAAVSATSRATIQAYGPATVRSNTTLTAGQATVAASVNATSKAADVSQTTTMSAEYVNSIIGVCLGVTNATNAIVQLRLL